MTRVVLICQTLYGKSQFVLSIICQGIEERSLFINKKDGQL